MTVGGLNTQEKISSIEIVKQVNLFRSEEDSRAVLQHADLLKIIRDEFSDEIGIGNISETLYTHEQNGQKYPMFELTLSQAKQVLVRESKFVRKAVIAYIDKLEQTIVSQFQIPQTLSQALLLASQQAEQIEQQQLQLTEQAPKVLFANAVTTSTQSCLIGELAKIIKQNGVEIGQNRLFEWLRDNNYLCTRGESYNLPTQRAMEMKLFEVKKGTVVNADGSVRVTATAKVTGRGQVYFVNKLLTANITI